MENFLKECFNTKWRWNRKKFWLYPLWFNLGIFSIIWLVFTVQSLITSLEDMFSAVVLIIIVILYILTFYVSILAYIKRLRDLDKNPWMALILIIPLVAFYVMIICWFFKWTIWSNKYWPNPLWNPENKDKKVIDETKVEL